MASKRRKVGIELPEQTVRLPQDEIDLDLASILGERKQRAEESTARLNKKTIGAYYQPFYFILCLKKQLGLPNLFVHLFVIFLCMTDNFKSERRRLFCGKYILQDGDEVVVSSPVISEDYIGIISSVTDDAVR